MRLSRITDRIAEQKWLDRVNSRIHRVVTRVLPEGSVKDALHGVWLGHPVHPAMVQLPVGCFLSAAVLDVTTPGSRAARVLVGTGIASAMPAAVSGWADWSDAHEEQQRTGTVHALLNTAGLACYLVSFVARRDRSGRTGSVSGGAGMLFLLAGATLGGELSFRQALGPNHAEDAAHRGPNDWCDLGPLDDFSEGRPEVRDAGNVKVVVLRSGSDVVVLHDACSHLSAPLHEGEVEEVAGHRCLVCPWHGSTFRLSDGEVMRGPATAPQPRLISRVRAGRVEARARTYAGVPAS
ncbi:Rieske 2Fe-2S domain-containing protein [Actinoalloteichus caeruleus]|uniref:Rieske 2Fe-2S domain-containing protein n=1 Tax=Actinoalloteichus cyanogriseus TaxID=2893586 RepID=UPI0004AA39DB|nr:Rieske 2Fe-2S domain-containing protein [Actinoalloteichus caeruleus]